MFAFPLFQVGIEMDEMEGADGYEPHSECDLDQADNKQLVRRHQQSNKCKQ